jgi:hypothetical protein
MSFRVGSFGTGVGGGAWTGGETILAVAVTIVPGTTALIARFTGRGILNSAAFRRALIVPMVVYGGRGYPGPLQPRACNGNTPKSMKDWAADDRRGRPRMETESLPRRLAG